MLLDRDLREPLFEFLEETYGKIRIIEEKNIGRSRADVVMVTEDSVCGIEIKSDADSYARLARQVRDYSLYFDTAIIAVGTRHAMHVEEHVPDWWGIITLEEVDGEVDSYMLRRPRPNPQADLTRKLSFLWREELERILLANGMPRYTSLSKKKIRARLMKAVPQERLHLQISEQLFERDYNKIKI
ncbi:MAG: sce7726 family protein [Lachnospiraceae bacterium]|nr:sce7726 family protein [Lachnospiraceae bacterium]